MNTCAELFIALLESQNFHYSSQVDDDGDVIIGFPFKGKTFRCFFNDKYLSLYCVYENIPEDKLVDVIFLCNELNTKYKWITFYVDHDKDMMLHDDAILSTENAAEEAMELLVRCINIGEEIKPLVMKAIYA